jgi:protein-disulfide isomerase
MPGPADPAVGDLQPAPRASLVDRRPKLTLAVLVALSLGTTVLLRARPADHRALGRTPVVENVLADRETPAVGPADAPVTVVVFTDYQCPICRATDPALERLIRSDPKVRVLFKDWPVLGPPSRLAARYALAARRQGRYLDLHRALMETRLPLTPDNLQRLAAGAGLDGPRLAADLARDGAVIDAQLDRQAYQAWTLGLAGTPDYLVGTDLYQGGLDDRALTRAVARARR